MSKRQEINPTEWLATILSSRGTTHELVLKKAIQIYDENTHRLLLQGLAVADSLLELGLDTDTLTAAIISPAQKNGLVTIEMIMEEFDEGIAKLVNDLSQMQIISQIRNLKENDSQQLEKMRKLFLAMVTDVRAVLIMLSEQIWLLHQAKYESEQIQQQRAQDTIKLFAPLANRLGVWQLKWQLEDLSIRYLEPDQYKSIAKGITSRRHEREQYIDTFKKTLSDTLHQSGIKNFQLTGRVKHIYSIYKKMQRKNANLEAIYDMTALRVLTDSIENCYAVLSVLQEHWKQVPEEFDDYIANPKPNGYQSIHTVLIGPGDHFVEVQIRTHHMHQESELGVAAHWRYKEGVLHTKSDEAKIALLRQVMAWQKEVTDEVYKQSDMLSLDLFKDRIYVFTPLGDILDLPVGSTPIDFAYTVHSEVGHRCKGAKVDGHITTLNTPLQTGQRIEILTAKHPQPSRDWLNPQLGYIKSSRTRAKIQHWFKMKDQALSTGQTPRERLEQECKRLGIELKLGLDHATTKLRYKSSDDLLLALSKGELRVNQVIPHLIPRLKEQKPPELDAGHKSQSMHLSMLGIDNMLTHLARCCKPLPGDEVLGYITRQRGLSIHRRDCKNLAEMHSNNPDRAIEIDWGRAEVFSYPTDVCIRVSDRAGMLRDITSYLVAEHVEIIGLTTQKMDNSDIVDIYVTIKVTDKNELDSALRGLQKIDNILEIHRR